MKKRLSKGALARIEKALEARPIPFKPRMNNVRKALIDKMGIALAAHAQREDVGDMRHYWQAVDMNNEFIDRSRGKGKKGGMVKSVALQRDNTTFFPMDKRNGDRECSRRLRA